MDVIPVFKPYIGSDTLKAASDALDLGWLGMGSLVREFESAMSAYLELPPGRQAVAVNTCTSALHLALLVAGVQEDDEVITPALNNIGDFQAIAMCGAKPVFVDINEGDLGIEPEKLERLIGPRVKAIIPLHYAGIPCRIDAIREVAERHGLRVIEDLAHATGTRHAGVRLGADGDLACFSFDAIKTLTCIDGGLVVVPSLEEAERLFPLRLLGMTQPNERLYSNSRAYQYDVFGQGFRYHLANLHASIGLSQLRKLPEFIANRQRYCRLYKSLLADIPGLVLPSSDFDDCSMFVFVVRVLEGKRAELASHLKALGIDTGIHWLPGNRFTWLKGVRGAGELPITDRVGDEILTLPLWSVMPDEVIVRVANGIRDYYGRPSALAGTAVLRGRQLLAAVKARGSAEYRVPVKGIDRVWLRPVCATDPVPGDVETLTDWRNRHVKSFLTEFDATPAQTRQWLVQNVANDETRVLFMIEEDGSPPLGYIGLAFINWREGAGEADAVVRGRDGHQGLMTAALRTLIDWAGTELGLTKFGVRVLADNPANAFYKRFGFQEVKRTPLAAVRRTDSVAWSEVLPGVPHDDRWLIQYELPSEPH